MSARVAIAIAAACLAVGAAEAQTAQRAAPAATQQTQQTPDSVRKAARADKRGLVEKNMQLTADEAAKFWPLYDEYQTKLDQVIDRQNRAILDYINAESTMTDANARRIAREVLETDADEQKLRGRYLRKMQAVLPAKKAVRYMQIENKLRTLQRYDIAERISLVR
jgi:succinate dehydrogenase flavin-adding protein (antitoxin of CptAB toxin-antitoxin module)